MLQQMASAFGGFGLGMLSTILLQRYRLHKTRRDMAPRFASALEGYICWMSRTAEALEGNDKYPASPPFQYIDVHAAKLDMYGEEGREILLVHEFLKVHSDGTREALGKGNHELWGVHREQHQERLVDGFDEQVRACNDLLRVFVDKYVN